MINVYIRLQMDTKQESDQFGRFLPLRDSIFCPLRLSNQCYRSLVFLNMIVDSHGRIL